MRIGSLSIILALFISYSIQAQSFQERSYFGAILEPNNGIIHGAGQSPDAFENYWNAVDSLQKPIIYMYYTGIRGLQASWYKDLKVELLKRKDYMLIPQIGLSMTSDGSPEQHYEQDVAAGLYDDEIDLLIEGLRKLGTPAYIRIGYEFNGVTWNGYEKESYKAAYIYLTDKFRESGLEIATVWCASMDGDRQFYDYYPGDEYVDWWGIDIFDQNHFWLADSQNFMDSAAAHNKPVMFGESTPRGIGTKGGVNSWVTWFQTYFSFIKAKPELKMTGYINWDWNNYPQWPGWGDARIEDSGYVGNRYRGEKDSSIYLQSMTEFEFRNLLEYEDDQAPATPENFSNLGEDGRVILTWDEVIDASGIARYKIYRNEELYDFTNYIPYTDPNLEPGETYEYTVSAMDRSGVESSQTSSISIQTPDEIELLLNNEFDNSTTEWELGQFEGGQGLFSIDNSGRLSGDNSAKVENSNTTSTDWHVQLRQPFQLKEGNTYTIRFQATSDVDLIFNTVIQQANAPYAIYDNIITEVNSSAQTYATEFTATEDDNVYLAMFLGAIGNQSVYIDSVSVIEQIPVTVSNEEEIEIPETAILHNAYPNPFNPSTNIQFELPLSAKAVVRVFDLLGRPVAELFNGNARQGVNEVKFDATFLSSGVYLIQLSTGNEQKYQKVTLIK